MFRAAILLTLSNVFMTFAWYGHLRFTRSPLWAAVLASWAIAFFEYCLQVPANRIGPEAGMSGAQLKKLQEVRTPVVCLGIGTWTLRAHLRWTTGVWRP